MIRHSFTAPAVFLAGMLAASGIGHAQTFKVEKFDIKGDGGTDYIAAESATGRVYVSRGTHMMVVDGPTGKVLGDIPDTPGVHGAGIATKSGHGFTTDGGNSMVTMFDLKTLAVIKQIPVMQGGLDGIMYDEPDDKIILTNHSRPMSGRLWPNRRNAFFAAFAHDSNVRRGFQVDILGPKIESLLNARSGVVEQ